MIALLISSLLSLFFFITFGIYSSKSLNISSNPIETLLLGLVVTNTLSSYLSLFFPIDLYITAFFVFCALAILFFKWNDIKDFAQSILQRKYILLYSISFIVIAFNISLGPATNYDSGLYHIQAIKWIHEYAAVPGLANLHGRFGFNPNIFTLFSLTSLYSLFNQEIFSLNFILFSVVVIYIVNILFKLYKRNGFSNLFFFYAFIFYIVLQLTNNLSSPAPDYFSISIPLLIFMRFVDISLFKENIGFKDYVPILILSVYILTVKLAALPILLLFIFVLIKFKPSFKSAWGLLFISVVILFPWIARNVILTGWLVYPFPTLDLFDFDWKLPVQTVIYEKNAVIGWARDPAVFMEAAKMSTLEWFPLWWEKFSVKNIIYITSSVIFPLIIIVAQLINLLRVSILKNAVVITSFIGVLFWFFLAPDLRFGEAFICTASISPLLIINFNWKPIFSSVYFFTGIILLFTFYLVRKKDVNIRYVLTPKKIEIPDNLDYRSYKINEFDIFIPTDGDRCFDHPIPCTTPYANSNIGLRGSSLASGFKIKADLN